MTRRWRTGWPTIVLGLVVLGLGLRLFHYARNYPMWHDEATPVLNVLAKGYAELWGPRLLDDTTPPLFLWLEKTVVNVLGDETFALRAVSLLAACLSLVGLVWLARRFLTLPALACLAGLFACSDRLLFHGCEAKPYAMDVLVAVGLMGVLHRGGASSADDERRGDGQNLLILALLSLLLPFLTYPSVFLLAGAALVYLPVAYRTGRASLWWRYGVFVLLLGGSLLFLVRGPVHAIQTTGVWNCWKDYFPSWNQPWWVPAQMAVRTLETFRYAQEPIGHVLAIFAVVGGVVLWRGGQRRLVTFLLMPLSLNLLAWLVGRYPLGAFRVVAYSAPALLILVAAGLPPALRWSMRQNRVAGVALALVVVLPLGQASFRVARPWQRLDSASPAAHVLKHRAADEPVFGDLWEQAYYFRRLGTMHHRRPPAWPPQDGLRSFWFLGNHRDQRDFLPDFLASADWQVNERIRYRGITLLHLRKKAGSVEESEQ